MLRATRVRGRTSVTLCLSARVTRRSGLSFLTCHKCGCKVEDSEGPKGSAQGFFRTALPGPYL